MIGKMPAQQSFLPWDLLAVLSASCRACIAAGEKRGSARCANRALTIRSVEGDSITHQAIHVGRLGMSRPKSPYRVIALLIRADPKDVGPLMGHEIPSARV